MKARIADVVCLFMITGMLAIGLSPFRPPKNGVSWLPTKNGIHVGADGIVLSSAGFHAGPENAPCTLEVWLEPRLAVNSRTLLSFSTPGQPLAFSIIQYGPHLLLQRHDSSGVRQSDHIGIAEVFRPGNASFIAMVSGTQGSAVYIDGLLKEVFPGFRFGKQCAGQLLIGTSSVVRDGWVGRIYGIAVLKRELTADRILQHRESWIKNGRPYLLPDERAGALYLFDERAGDTVHNALGQGIDLYIPTSYILPHQWLLQPFWDEYRPGWPHLKDILINIVGFIPLGFFLRHYWTVIRSIKYPTFAVLISGLALSLTIEILQSYLPTRSSGTTDLITNTLGTFLGSSFYAPKYIRHLLAQAVGGA